MSRIILRIFFIAEAFLHLLILLATGQYQSGYYYGTYWWSSTEATPGNAYAAYCGSLDIDKVGTAERNKKYGLSVRCLKD